MMTTLPCVRIRRCRIPEGTEVGELIYFCVEEFLSTGVGGVYLWAKKPKTVGDIACHSHTLLSASSGVPTVHGCPPEVYPHFRSRVESRRHPWLVARELTDAQKHTGFNIYKYRILRDVRSVSERVAPKRG